MNSRSRSLVTVVLIACMIAGLIIPFTLGGGSYGDAATRHCPSSPHKIIRVHLSKIDGPVSFTFLSTMPRWNVCRIVTAVSGDVQPLIFEWRLFEGALSGSGLAFTPVQHGECMASRLTVLHPVREQCPDLRTIDIDVKELSDSRGKVFRFEMVPRLSPDGDVTMTCSATSKRKMSVLMVGGSPLPGTLDAELRLVDVNALSSFATPSPETHPSLASFQDIIVPYTIRFQSSVWWWGLLVLAAILITHVGREQNDASDAAPYASGAFFWAALTLITIVAFIVRYRLIAHHALTFDESFSTHMSSLPLITMLKSLIGDKHPPFYYLLLKIWAFFGAKDMTEFRLLSVVAGTLTVPVVALIARSMPGCRQTCSLLAAWILCFLPFHLAQSAEIRMYSLLGFLSGLSVLLYTHAAKEKRCRFTVAALWFVNTLLVCTHYFGFLPVVFEAFHALIRREQRGRWWSNILFYGLSLLPGLLWFIANVHFLREAPKQHLKAFDGQALSSFFWSTGSVQPLSESGLPAVLLGGVFFVLMLTGMIHRLRQGLSIDMIIYIGSMVTTIIVSQVIPVYQAKNVMIVIPFMAIYTACGFYYVVSRQRPLKIAALVLIMAISLLGARCFALRGLTIDNLPRLAASAELFPRMGADKLAGDRDRSKERPSRKQKPEDAYNPSGPSPH